MQCNLWGTVAGNSVYATFKDRLETFLKSKHILSLTFGICFCENKVPGTHKGGEGEQLEPRNLSRDSNVTLIAVQTGNPYHGLTNPSPCVPGGAIIVAGIEHTDDLYEDLAPVRA